MPLRCSQRVSCRLLDDVGDEEEVVVPLLLGVHVEQHAADALALGLGDKIGEAFD